MKAFAFQKYLVKSEMDKAMMDLVPRRRELPGDPADLHTPAFPMLGVQGTEVRLMSLPLMDSHESG